MSICLEIEKIVAQQQTERECDEVFKSYETASEHFKNLVKIGVASERGYQLLPLENRMDDNISINHQA